MVRTSPVSVLVTVIETLGTTEPEGSVTVPTTVASWPKALNDRAATRDRQRTRKRHSFLLFTALGMLPAHMGERDFIPSSRLEAELPKTDGVDPGYTFVNKCTPGVVVVMNKGCQAKSKCLNRIYIDLASRK